MRLSYKQAGDGPPVALLHGLFGRSDNFTLLQRKLSEAFRVISLDLRNHGISPHAGGMAYADQAADVLETLHALHALPCALMGHSMGGKVAMAVALTSPGSVTRLLVSDIAPVPYGKSFRDYVEAMQKLPASLSRAAAAAEMMTAVPDARVRNFLLQNYADGSWTLGLDEIAAGLPDIEAWNIGCIYLGRVLFVAGGKSDYILQEHRPVIRRLFPAARFLILRNAGHWVHADDPEGFTSVLLAFLET